jgi:multisubunit Na+/H+ antiporter MnhF subunit
MSTTSELLAFKRRPNEYFWIIPQFPIILGGKIVLVDMLVVQGPLNFNMLLGCDYLYVMNVVVCMLFHVMHFPHNGRILTID